MGHKTLSAKNDAAYWNFSWTDEGLYDNSANLRKIKEVSKVDKAFYIGYSIGTMQMFYGLAHREDSFFANSLYKVVQLAPCFVISNSDNLTKKSQTEIDKKMHDNGILAVFGPNWDKDIVKMCANLPKWMCD